MIRNCSVGALRTVAASDLNVYNIEQIPVAAFAILTGIGDGPGTKAPIYAANSESVRATMHAS